MVFEQHVSSVIIPCPTSLLFVAESQHSSRRAKASVWLLRPWPRDRGLTNDAMTPYSDTLKHRSHPPHTYTLNFYPKHTKHPVMASLSGLASPGWPGLPGGRCGKSGKSRRSWP